MITNEERMNEWMRAQERDLTHLSRVISTTALGRNSPLSGTRSPGSTPSPAATRRPEEEPEVDDRNKRSDTQGNKENKFEFVSTEQLNDKLVSIQNQIQLLQMSAVSPPINKGENPSYYDRDLKDTESYKSESVVFEDRGGPGAPHRAALAPQQGYNSPMTATTPRPAADMLLIREAESLTAAETGAPEVAAQDDAPEAVIPPPRVSNSVITVMLNNIPEFAVTKHRIREWSTLWYGLLQLTGWERQPLIAIHYIMPKLLYDVQVILQKKIQKRDPTVQSLEAL